MREAARELNVIHQILCYWFKKGGLSLNVIIRGVRYLLKSILMVLRNGWKN